MTTWRVCSVRGCTELVNNTTTCPEHPPHRTKNAHWSPDRDRTAQRRFRQAVLQRDRHTCTRCGHHDPTGRTLQAHHDRAGYDPSAGRTLCTDCHKAVDPSAR